MLGYLPADCAVVEDPPPGIAAGKAAGARVVAVTTTHPPAALGAADVLLSGLAQLRARPAPLGGGPLVLEW